MKIQKQHPEKNKKFYFRRREEMGYNDSSPKLGDRRTTDGEQPWNWHLLRLKEKISMLEWSFVITEFAKKVCVGCVISPLRQHAESRKNLGHTFLANSVHDARKNCIRRSIENLVQEVREHCPVKETASCNSGKKFLNKLTSHICVDTQGFPSKIIRA